MTKPIEQVPPDELWVKLTSVPRPHKLVDLPRKDPTTDEPIGQIAMWPLTQEELMICNAEADRFTKALLKDPQKKDEANLGYEHTYGNDLAIQTLFRASRKAGDLTKAAFPSTVLMRRNFTQDEVSALYHSYMLVQAELGPIVRLMSDEELEALTRRIEQGGSSFPLASLSWEQQAALVSFMAKACVRYWTATSSAGSPPGASPVEDPVDAPEEPPLVTPPET